MKKAYWIAIYKQIKNPEIIKKYAEKAAPAILRYKGILLSTDGPFNNVIKIKPPMVFNKKNADVLCSEINNFLIHKNKK